MQIYEGLNLVLANKATPLYNLNIFCYEWELRSSAESVGKWVFIICIMQSRRASWLEKNNTIVLEYQGFMW